MHDVDGVRRPAERRRNSEIVIAIAAADTERAMGNPPAGDGQCLDHSNVARQLGAETGAVERDSDAL